MNPKDMKSNEDLHEYLCWLAEELRKRGQEGLADKVAAASDFACGSPSEFLHEVERALKEVRASVGSMLSDREKEDIGAAVQQIDEAFKKVGGA